MIDAIANLQGRERSAIELSSLFNEEADSPSPQVVSNPKLVGWWMVHAMRLGLARSAEPLVGPLKLFKIGPSNSPETGPSTGGSPER
jgi:hypothetical protein